VEIGGTAAAPVVRLISEPEVADAEKLSWLVLGTGLADAQAAGQLPALQAAAATMFGGDRARHAPGLTGRLAIDRLAVREQVAAGSTAGGPSDTAEGTVVSVGKRLSSRLFMTCQQSLRAVWNILRLQYEITDRLSFSGQAGSDSAADVLWHFPFD
jgi:translocation and assembly module TamB